MDQSSGYYTQGSSGHATGYSAQPSGSGQYGTRDTTCVSGASGHYIPHRPSDQQDVPWDCKDPSHVHTVETTFKDRTNPDDHTFNEGRRALKYHLATKPPETLRQATAFAAKFSDHYMYRSGTHMDASLPSQEQIGLVINRGLCEDSMGDSSAEIHEWEHLHEAEVGYVKAFGLANWPDEDATELAKDSISASYIPTSGISGQSNYRRAAEIMKEVNNSLGYTHYQ